MLENLDRIGFKCNHWILIVYVMVRLMRITEDDSPNSEHITLLHEEISYVKLRCHLVVGGQCVSGSKCVVATFCLAFVGRIY